MTTATATAADALARTTRLINQQIFDGHADENAIAAGLTGTTVRLIANEQNLTSRAGQAALATTFQLIARTGIGIELLAHDTPLRSPVPPPLRAPRLRAALLDLGQDLIPGTTLRTQPQHVDLTIAFGDSPTNDPHALRAEATDLGYRITPASGAASRITSQYPLGGLAAAAALAAIALDAALPNIEAAAGIRRSSRPQPPPGPPVDIDLRTLFPTLQPGPHDLGPIDVISAGAITNALLSVLSWIPQLSANIRIFDDDTAALHNLNRCLQFRASDTDPSRKKVDVLQQQSTQALQITGIPRRFTQHDTATINLAPHVLVGADDIKTRWHVQESWPAHLYIGATTNNEAILTTHQPGQPCAGCAHPDANTPPGAIPTISFISYWAGLLQASALLTAASPPAAHRLAVYPFALGGDAWWNPSQMNHSANCPVGCAAPRPVCPPPQQPPHQRLKPERRDEHHTCA